MAEKIVLFAHTCFKQFSSTCYTNATFQVISFSSFIQCITIKIHDISIFWKSFEIYETSSFTKYSPKFALHYESAESAEMWKNFVSLPCEMMACHFYEFLWFLSSIAVKTVKKLN